MAMEDIDHIVVLMLENRSFDHMLGDLSLSKGRKDVNGLAEGMSNPDALGVAKKIKAVTTEKFITDAGHAFEDVQKQLASVGGKPMQGFVQNYALKFDTPARQKKFGPEIMSYQTENTVPIHYWLADEYAISDTWYCPVPSETWPNRIFAAAATTTGRLNNGLPLYNLPTIFSRLRDRNLEWAIYNDQFPNAINIRHLAGEFLRSRHKEKSRFRSIKQFEQDCAAGKLPQYSFIEPVYFFGGANDDHPPHDISKGQLFIAQIYLAIRRNEALWKKTMLLITTDEHGGFFDHEPPLQGDFIPAPDDFKGNVADFDFKQLGPRVPLLLVTPWVSRRRVFRAGAQEFFDHTSVIRTAAIRWGLEALTKRDAAARPFWDALDLAAPRTDDVATFKKIDAWFKTQRPKTLAAGEAAQQKETEGLDGRDVALLIASQGAPRTLASKDDVHSEFQESMEALAANVAAQSAELEAEVQ